MSHREIPTEDVQADLQQQPQLSSQIVANLQGACSWLEAVSGPPSEPSFHFFSLWFPCVLQSGSGIFSKYCCAKDMVLGFLLLGAGRILWEEIKSVIKAVTSSPPLSLPPSHQEVSSFILPYAAVMVCCLSTNAKAVGPSNHGLKSLKLNQNKPFLFQVDLL